MGTMGVRIEHYPRRLDDIGGAYPWVIPGWWVSNSAAIAIVVGRLYYTPIFVNERRIYDRIGVSVWIGGGAGTLARLGIYGWSDGLPGALILDAGTVPTIAMGAQSININQTLERGHYFLALVGDATPQLFSPSTTTCVPPVQGMSAILSPSVGEVILYLDGRVADVAGGLADPAPAPTAASDVTDAHVVLRGP